MGHSVSRHKAFLSTLCVSVDGRETLSQKISWKIVSLESLEARSPGIWLGFVHQMISGAGGVHWAPVMWWRLHQARVARAPAHIRHGMRQQVSASWAGPRRGGITVSPEPILPGLSPSQLLGPMKDKWYLDFNKPRWFLCLQVETLIHLQRQFHIPSQVPVFLASPLHLFFVLSWFCSLSLYPSLPSFCLSLSLFFFLPSHFCYFPFVLLLLILLSLLPFLSPHPIILVLILKSLPTCLS